MLSDVLQRFSTAAADGATGGYSVARITAASFGSTGLIVSGTPSTIHVDACVQPYSARALDVLPDGVKVEDVRMIDTLVPMQSNPPDIITIAGDSFAVFRVDGPNNYPDGSIRYSSYAARQAVPG